MEDSLNQVPYSTSALAFVPPGVMVVSEVWNVFAQEKISLCNGAINGMEFDNFINEIIKFPVLLYDTTPLRHRSGAFSVCSAGTLLQCDNYSIHSSNVACILFEDSICT